MLGILGHDQALARPADGAVLDLGIGGNLRRQYGTDVVLAQGILGILYAE